MLGHIGLPEKPEARWEWMMARISQRQMNTLFQIAYEILKNKDDTDDVISAEWKNQRNLCNNSANA